RRRLAEQRARLNTAQRLAVQSRAVRPDYPQRSLLLAVQALQALAPQDPRMPDVLQNLHDALGSAGGYCLGGHAGRVNKVALSKGGRWLATAGDDATVGLWGIGRGPRAARRFTLRAHKGAVGSVLFAEDRWLVSGGLDGVWLWDLTTADPSSRPV